MSTRATVKLKLRVDRYIEGIGLAKAGQIVTVPAMTAVWLQEQGYGTIVSY